MSFHTRSSAALTLLALVLATSAGAELVRTKPKRVLLASSSEPVVATFSKDLFREQLVLKSGPGCVALRFSGEISGVNKVGDARVVASFELAVDDTIAAAPAFHEAPTTSPRLVSIEGFACGLAAGSHEVSVRARAEDGDEVTLGARTLEIAIDGGRAGTTVSSVPAGR